MDPTGKWEPWLLGYGCHSQQLPAENKVSPEESAEGEELGTEQLCPVGYELPCWYNEDEIEAADINSGMEKRDEQNPFFGFLYLTEHASRQGSGMGSHLP